MQPGGAGAPPRAVGRAAAATLDALFPTGRRTRRLIGLAFWLVHLPIQLLPLWHTAAAGARRAVAAAIGGWLWLLAAVGRLAAGLRQQRHERLQ